MSTQQFDFPMCVYGDCKRRRFSHGYCSTHFYRSIGKQKKPMDAPIKEYQAGSKKKNALCTLAGCTNQVLTYKSGLCHRHYDLKKSGDPNWKRILKPRRKNGEVVNIGGVLIRRIVARKIKEVAGGKGISVSAQVNEILDDWFRNIRSDRRPSELEDRYRSAAWTQSSGYDPSDV